MSASASLPDDDTPRPIGSWDTAYGHFARLLSVAGSDAGTPPLVQPALVRLRAGDEGHAMARRQVIAWQHDGLILREAGPLPEDDDAFTVYWPDPDPRDAEARFSAALEVLGLGRPVDPAAPTDAGPAAQGPAAPSPCAAPSPWAAPRAPVMAVIDDGIGFLNARFRRDAGRRTRFGAIWLMAFRTLAAPGEPEIGVVQTGRVLRGPEIDAWLGLGDRLEEDRVYRALNAAMHEPDAFRATERGFSHGTHVLDLAAGADAGIGDPAEDWPLLAVQLPPEAVDNTAGTLLEPLIVQALRWILDEAEAAGGMAPLIVTVALATFAGPKDGTKAIEALMSQMLDRWQARTGRQARVMLAFGNARLNRQAARLGPAPGVVSAIDWRLPPDDLTASYLELRPPAADLGRLGLSVTPPGSGTAQVLAPLPPDHARKVRDAGGRAVGMIYHIGARPTAPGVTTPAHLVLAMAPTTERAAGPVAPHGAWSLRFSAGPGAAIPLRLEVQRDDTLPGHRPHGRQSWLDDPRAESWDAEAADYGAPGPGCPVTLAGTHSSFAGATSPAVLAVAAACADDGRPSRYSGEGHADLRRTPALAAAGDRSLLRTGILGAGTLSGSVRAADGTSAAAALAARAMALFHAGGGAPLPGAADADALIAAFGAGAAATDAARLGAGVLTWPPSPA